jgi:hypothetical protein
VALRGLGVVATCAPNGSGPWQDSWTTTLAPWPEVTVVVDNDPAGLARGEDILAALRRAGQRVRVLAPPPPHNDVSDMVRAGLPLSALVPLA